MKQLITTLTCLFLFLFSFAQTTEQKIDELLNAYVQLGKLNGTVLVAQGGEVVYQKGFGYRDAAGKILHTPESIFQIGSITKQFTAAVIMQLHQEKKLSVKDPLSKYFKGFVNGDKITVEHLLTHTSGLYNYTNDSVIMNNDVTQYYSQAKMVAIFQNYPADFEPGAKFNYSNSGYSMLGYIIEKVTRKPYEKVMRERIFQPLGMTHTGFDFTHLQHSNKSKGYFSITKDTAIAAPIVDSTIAHAAGAMYSTVADLLKWDRAVAAGKILSEASWKQVFTPHKSKYAYGWVIDSLHGRPVQGHSGGIHGFSSYILRFPKDDLAIIVIDNSSAPGGSIARNIGAILVGAPYKIPQAPKAVAMDAASLKKYEGVYKLSPNFNITIFLAGDQLKAQATGQDAFDLFAEKEHHFFAKVADIKIVFNKNAEGNIPSFMLHQSGVQTMGTRIEDNAVQKTLELSTALLKQYVGTYELAPGFYIDITLDGKVLKGQATGQDAFELFAEKDNLFYLKVVEAKVEFIKDEKGVVNELILYQGGREMKGFKTK